MVVNVTQRGIGRGATCDLLGYGAGGSDGQVILYMFINLGA